MEMLNLIVFAVLAVIAIGMLFVIARQSQLQRRLSADAETVALKGELAVLDEKLKARTEALERAHNELDTRQQELRDLQRELSAAQTELAGVRTEASKIPELIAERDQARTRLEATRQQLSELETVHGQLTTQLKEERRASEEKLQALENAEDRLKREFENLANRIFEQKHEKFAQQSREGVEMLLKPVREQLVDFRKKVEDVYEKEARDRTSLHNEIGHLKTLHERMSAEALNLTRALKGDSKLRGNWGEVQLERILEESGLTKGREYDVQVNLQNEQGQRLQPDVIVHLPEKKEVVIDAKVSLVAYDRYHAAENDDERERSVRDHVQSIRTHMAGLHNKNYDDLIGVNSLDLVVMFVPIEPAYLLALENDALLYSDAFKKGILLVSPTTLMGTLQIIRNIWRYEYQNQNAVSIATQAGALHDQFVRFIESLEEVGKALDRARAHYETAHKRLTSGKGNLVTRTERLQKLGAKAKKQMPDALVDEASATDEALPTDVEVLGFSNEQAGRGSEV